MTPPSEWHDWMTESFYRVRVAPAALTKLRALPDLDQDRLRLMLEEIASVADTLPPTSVGRAWTKEGREKLLLLSLGHVLVHYSLDERSRTLSVEHVTEGVAAGAGAGDLGSVAAGEGGGDLGQTG